MLTQDPLRYRDGRSKDGWTGINFQVDRRKSLKQKFSTRASAQWEKFNTDYYS